jgi:hypothetical protein
MDNDGARETLYPYAVRIRGCAGDGVVVGFTAVTAKHSGCALAVIYCNPFGFVFKKE